MSQPQTANINLIQKVETIIGDNKTILYNTNGNLKIETYYKDILEKTENNCYWVLDEKTQTHKIKYS